MVRDTSRSAYDDLRGSLPRRERLVWEQLLACSTAPTSYELTERMKRAGLAFDVNSCRPRLTALFDRGCVRRLGKRTCGVTGKTVYTWQAIVGRPPVKAKKPAAAAPATEARLF